MSSLLTRNSVVQFLVTWLPVSVPTFCIPSRSAPSMDIKAKKKKLSFFHAFELETRIVNFHFHFFAYSYNLDSSAIGFLDDSRRLNVAITRAKCSLFILGKSSILLHNPLWRALVLDFKRRKMFVPFNESFWEENRNLAFISTASNNDNNK